MKLSKFILTDKGRELLAKLVQGRCTTTFTNAAVSSLHLADTDIPALLTLPMTWKTAAVTKLLKVNTTTVQIEAAIDNSDVTTDQDIGSIGLYAMDPDDNEILYAAANVMDDTVFPAYEEGTAVAGISFQFDIVVSDADRVEIKVDPNGFATVRDARALRAGLLKLAQAAADGTVDEDLVALLKAGMLDITGDDNDDINVHEVTVDATLTQTGSAADAKAAGDRIRDIRYADDAERNRDMIRRYGTGEGVSSYNLQKGIVGKTYGQAITTYAYGRYISPAMEYREANCIRIRCPGYYIRAAIRQGDTMLKLIDYTQDEVYAYRVPGADRVLVGMRVDPDTDDELTPEQIADIDAKLYIEHDPVIPAEELSAYQTGYEAGKINRNKGLNANHGISDNMNGHALTNILNGSVQPLDAIELLPMPYRAKLIGYGESDATHSSFMGATMFFDCTQGARITRPREWNYCRMEFTRMPADTEPIEASDAAAIAGSMVFYDEKPEAYRKDVSREIAERTTMPLRQESYQVAFGGLKNGNSYKAANRLRLITQNGIGGFSVGAGTKISIASGFKFGIARFSTYIGDRDPGNKQLTRIEMGSVSEYTATQDEIWRIHIGANSNADLWSVVDGVNTVNALGQQALAAITFLRVQQSVVAAVDELQQQAAQEPSVRVKEIYKLRNALPINATEYHSLYDDLVAEGWLTRSEASWPVEDDSEKWPLYTYTLECNKKHLNQSYKTVTGELYRRPKILVTSGFHGNERGTPSYLYDFIQSMHDDSDLAPLAAAFDWVFIPLVNPWGYSHSLLKDGAVTFGSIPANGDYTGHSFIENTSAIHRGYRCNADREDCNRNWHDGTGGFPTAEAQYVKNVLVNGGFDFVMDMHQAYNSIDLNQVCGFISISKKPSGMPQEEYEEHLRVTYNQIAMSGIETDRRMSSALALDSADQTFFPWDGTTASTFRNYAGGYDPAGRTITFTDYPDYSLCLETSCVCIPYSHAGANILGWDNEIANSYGNTLTHVFFKRMLGYYLDHM